jgi:hypothetical protein
MEFSVRTGHLLSFIVVFFAGVGVGVLSARGTPAPASPASQTSSVPPLSVPASKGAALRRARPGVETAELEACRRSAAFLEGQLKTYEGVPQAWPEGVAPNFASGALRDQLSAAWAGKAEVREMDCEEYPCIVELQLTTGEPSCCSQLDDALPRELMYREGHANVQITDDGTFAVEAFGDPGRWNDGIALRASWRVEEAAALLRERLAETSA